MVYENHRIQDMKVDTSERICTYWYYLWKTCHMTNGVYKKKSEPEILEYTLTLEYYINGFNIIRAAFLIGD